MSNKISISLHSNSLTIEVLQELLQNEFAEDTDLQFSLKTEKLADSRGIDLAQVVIEIIISKGVEFIWDTAKDAVKDALKEQMTKVGEKVTAALKKILKARGTAKKSRIILETNNEQLIKQLANNDAPPKIDQDDEIKSIQVQEVNNDVEK